MNTSNNHVVVVKERQPGLLIELNSTLTTILSTRVLQASQGFTHPELKAEKLDFSGLSYYSSSDTLWIVSDKGGACSSTTGQATLFSSASISPSARETSNNGSANRRVLPSIPGEKGSTW